jgi:acyl-CoA dehydrogenase
MTVQEKQSAAYHGMTPDLLEVRDRLRSFINDVVIPAEPELEDQGRGGKRIQELKQQAKRDGLWALGHPR